MELECKTATPVQSCQWSFQQEGQTEPLVLKEGHPREEKDCSLSLEQVSYEQVGAWRCGARAYDTDDYTFADTVNIQVEHKDGKLINAMQDILWKLKCNLCKPCDTRKILF